MTIFRRSIQLNETPDGECQYVFIRIGRRRRGHHQLVRHRREHARTRCFLLIQTCRRPHLPPECPSDHRGSQGRRLGGLRALSLLRTDVRKADGPRTRAMSHRTAKRKSVFPGQRGRRREEAICHTVFKKYP